MSLCPVTQGLPAAGAAWPCDQALGDGELVIAESMVMEHPDGLSLRGLLLESRLSWAVGLPG